MSKNAHDRETAAPAPNPFAPIGFSGPDERTLLEMERNWLNRFHERVLRTYEGTARKILAREGVPADIVGANKRRQRAILGPMIRRPITESEARFLPASWKQGQMVFEKPFLWPAVILLQLIEKSRDLQYQREFALMEKVDTDILRYGNRLFDAVQAAQTRRVSGKLAGAGKRGKLAPSTELIRRALIYDRARAEGGDPSWVEGRTRLRSIGEALDLLVDEGNEDVRDDVTKANPPIGTLTECMLDDDGCLRLTFNGKPAAPIKRSTLKNVPSLLKKRGWLDP